MTKRRKFIITSVLLSVGFVALQNIPDQYKITGVGLLGLFTILLFLWSLWGKIGFDATLITLILPVFFTTGVGLFWFLLPTNILVSTIIILIYALGMYALSLTANIYTVSAIRTIALLRSARGVGFVLTMISAFLLFDAVLSLRTSVWFVVMAVFVSSFLLFLQSFWAISLGRNLKKDILTLVFFSAFSVAEVSALLYFWPITVVVGSLFLTTTLYVLTGLGQASSEGRLFASTAREYLTLAAAVFLGMFLTTSWAG